MSLVETIKYAKNKKWLDISTDLKNTDSIDTKLNNLILSKQEDYNTKLNFKKTLDELQNETTVNGFFRNI